MGPKEVAELLEQRYQFVRELSEMIETADREDREITNDEFKRAIEIDKRCETISRMIDREETPWVLCPRCKTNAERKRQWRT